MITVAGLTGVRAAIFDFNGTITDDETLQYEIYAGLCAELLGFELDSDTYFHDFAGRSDPEIVADLLTRAGHSDGGGFEGGFVTGGGHPHPAVTGWGAPSPSDGGDRVTDGGSCEDRASGGPHLADRVPGEPVLAERVLADRVLADRVLADRVLAERVLAERVLAERVRRYGDAVRERPPVRPGTIALIRALRGRVPLAVTTGALRAEVDAILTACGLAEAFDAIVTIEDLSAGKPDPEGFLLALDLLKRRGQATSSGSPPLEPDDVVVFEDSPYGIAAAHAAGMRCVAAHLTSEPTGFLPGAVVDTLGPELLGP